MNASRVTIILPVLNEEAALPWVLARVPAGYDALVVDNGSTDRSADVARNLGATVVAEPRRGFGAACDTGLRAATGDLVAFMDCDGSLDPCDLPALVDAVQRDGNDLVLGRRIADRGAMPTHARLANAYLASRLRRHLDLDLRDLGPMRVGRRQSLLALGIEDRRFGWPLEMVVRAAGAGWRVAERPVRYRARTGRSKVTGTVRGTARAIHDMRRVLQMSASVGAVSCSHSSGTPAARR